MKSALHLSTILSTSTIVKLWYESCKHTTSLTSVEISRHPARGLNLQTPKIQEIILAFNHYARVERDNPPYFSGCLVLPKDFADDTVCLQTSSRSLHVKRKFEGERDTKAIHLSSTQWRWFTTLFWKMVNITHKGFLVQI